MGYDVKGWLAGKVFGPGKKPRKQPGASGYLKPKRITQAELDKADIPKYRRRGDTDGEYDTYKEDRRMDTDEEVIHVYED